LERLRGLDCLTVSIDALPATHDALRGFEGAFDRACEALRLAARHGIPRGTNTVIQRANAAELLPLFRRLIEETDGRLDYVRHAPVEVVPDTAELMVTPEQVAGVQEQLRAIAAECDRRDIYFSHRKQLLEHLALYLDKRTRHRPLEGCRIPRKFIGYSELGFYLCWHQGHSIRAGSLVEALESEIAGQVVGEAAQGRCGGCNALTYSWDEEWNEGILAGKLVQDGPLPDPATKIHGQWAAGRRSDGDARAATELLAGVNLPYIGDAYNHDLAPNEGFPDWGYEFRPLDAYRYLAICRELGFRVVRIWLCENGEGLRLDGEGRVVGVMEELLRSVRALQDGARLLGLKIYWTLLDGNAWRRNEHATTGQIAADPEQTARFAERVAAAVARQLDPELTFAVEVWNEPESLSEEVEGDRGLPWPTIVRSIRTVREALRQVLPGVPVTSGTQAVFLPGLLADLVAGGSAPVDAVDLHVYHPTGGLPSRADLPVDIGALPLWAGECGAPERRDAGVKFQRLNYLYNARTLGYEAAFLWKLQGDRHLVRVRERATADGWCFETTALGSEVRDLLRRQWAERP
ncbi:MAG: hypothetical protein ABI333_02505, partial [bacterium]